MIQPKSGIKSKLRAQILKGRGLEPARRRGLKRQELPPPDGTKTLVMRQLEVRFDTSIEVLLRYGNLEETAKFLGVRPSTVSVWRLRLGLREKKPTGTPDARD